MEIALRRETTQHIAIRSTGLDTSEDVAEDGQ
jgi:hypothetical protein